MSAQRIPVWTWRDAVCKADVPPLTKLVCLVIANFLSDAGKGCFPGTKLLMAYTGLSNRSLATHIQNADKYGLLSVTRDRGSDGRIRRTTYRPRFPEHFELAREPASDSFETPDDQVNDVHAAKPCEGGSRGKRKRAASQVNDVHLDSPCEDNSPGPCEPDDTNHVNEVHGNYPLEHSTSPPNPQGNEGEGVLFDDQAIQPEPSADLIVGWAKGWTEAAQSEIAALFGNPLAGHVATDFLLYVVGTLNPPLQADAAAYVRQLRHKLQPFSSEVLRKLGERLIETRSRDLPATAQLVELAGDLKRAAEAQAKREEIVGAYPTRRRYVITRGAVQWQTWLEHLRALGRADDADRATAAGAITVTHKFPQPTAELVAIGEVRS